MSARRRARGYALQALYMTDLAGQPAEAALASAFLSAEVQNEPVPEGEAVEFSDLLTKGVLARKEEIDALIESSSTNWRIGRMPVVDRNILRIAVFELLALPEVPGTVAINESIELAKRYGTADSKAFVNGIVDRVARTLRRLDAPVPNKRRSKP